MFRPLFVSACRLCLVGLLFESSIECLRADDTPKENASKPVTFTTQEDHRNMMEQLGITKLRPGPSGNEKDANHANYDESLANPYPDLPEVLVSEKGLPIDTAEKWWQIRRPEIIEDFEREVVGRIPENVPSVKWEVVETRDAMAGDIPVVEQHIVGTVDNSACPEIEVKISMSLTLAKDASKPVPVLMMFGRTPFDPMPQFGRPRPQNQNGNAGQAGQNQQGGNQNRVPPGGFGPQGPSQTEMLVKAGWGCVKINPQSIQADSGGTGPFTPKDRADKGDGLTRGIIGLTNHGQPRKPDDWGSLRAWGWGASRGLDYLTTEPKVDATKVGIEGVSRYGKAALVTMAFDTRFAVVLIGSSGEGGAKLHRRNFGEAVENLTGSGEYHWMAGNFLKYGTAESSFGSKNAGDLPVDAHELIALCAPRLTFISYGIPEKGDAKWLDQQGSYMASIAAGPVFKLLGARDLGKSDDYKTEKMPDVLVGLLDGELAWRQHDGGHTDVPNTEHFLSWANQKFAEKSQSHN